MMSIIPSRGGNCYVGVYDQLCRKGVNKVQHSVDFFPSFPSRRSIFSCDQRVVRSYRQTARKFKPILASSLDEPDADDSEEDGSENKTPLGNDEDLGANSKLVRENLERMVGRDDASFSGRELATLIRNKFGKSYDVQFIKKEFMGRNLLALNVMWKYMEQRSFPLTEEEYLLRLDDVANRLKCWGAVSHIRNSLANLRAKERPRIGKAVSIFIDMDESGGRSNEWIYK